MNILLIGFYGEGNLGDDTILNCLTHNLDNKHQLFITSGKKINSTRGVKIKRRGLLSWPAFINTVKTCEHTILSGGILQDWSFEGVTFFALRMLAARLAGSKVSLWGAGLGPIKRKGLIPIAKRALKKVNCAWLRDAQSQSFFEQLTKKKANLGTDWSWDIELGNAMNSTRNLTGINLRSWSHANWEKIFNREKINLSGQFLGLAARDHDIDIIRSQALDASVIKPDDFEDLLWLCGQLDKGIAMRYHIALAMLRSKVPVKLIAYDDKVNNLAINAKVSILSEEYSSYKIASPDFLQRNYRRIAEMRLALKNYIENGI